MFNLVDILVSDLQNKSAPEAYLIYALYDQDSNRYEVGKQLLTRNASNQHEVLEENLYISEDGYMETFVVNETSENVWFDDMMVRNTSSPIAQETHYDPWGLELSGIGFQYGGFKANKYLYNGNEIMNDLNLGLYDFKSRFYDPIIGRFTSIDVLADHPNQFGISPYSAFWNNPIRFNDPNGQCPICPGSYYYMKANMILSQFSTNIKAPSQRLLTGQSGNLNSEYSSKLSNSQASLMSSVSTVNDGLAVATGIKAASLEGGLLGAEILQDVGTVVEIGGIATAQPAVTKLGGWISGSGSLLEGAIKASKGDLTTNEIGYQVGKGIVFSQLFKGGDKAVESKTLSKEANNVWQGVVKGWEMLSDWTYEIITSVDNEKKK